MIYNDHPIDVQEINGPQPLTVARLHSVPQTTFHTLIALTEPGNTSRVLYIKPELRIMLVRHESRWKLP